MKIIFCDLCNLDIVEQNSKTTWLRLIFISIIFMANLYLCTKIYKLFSRYPNSLYALCATIPLEKKSWVSHNIRFFYNSVSCASEYPLKRLSRTIINSLQIFKEHLLLMRDKLNFCNLKNKAKVTNLSCFFRRVWY